jgi:xylulokinase
MRVYARALRPCIQIVAVSGSGQQHGSVYWRQGARSVLLHLKHEQPLEPQLRGVEGIRGRERCVCVCVCMCVRVCVCVCVRACECALALSLCHTEQFSFADSPIWMDSSTSAQCNALEAALGGPEVCVCACVRACVKILSHTSEYIYIYGVCVCVCVLN